MNHRVETSQRLLTGNDVFTQPFSRHRTIGMQYGAPELLYKSLSHIVFGKQLMPDMVAGDHLSPKRGKKSRKRRLPTPR
jgi:hypothetical protein